ncbi:hypothetical protein CCUS01_04069 [Colletotrichum cuscutae]|uniref:Uncharacterized protein n=1 Tax=Colletotrichum cuscutae TaxID=1209917 RepID=A0AAI9VEQ6_9PEZI|nr:hypothetical protein CCUS01_04069 [Colletotrichum cuscutae]
MTQLFFAVKSEKKRRDWESLPKRETLRDKLTPSEFRKNSLLTGNLTGRPGKRVPFFTAYHKYGTSTTNAHYTRAYMMCVPFPLARRTPPGWELLWKPSGGSRSKKNHPRMVLLEDLGEKAGQSSFLRLTYLSLSLTQAWDEREALEFLAYGSWKRGNARHTLLFTPTIFIFEYVSDLWRKSRQGSEENQGPPTTPDEILPPLILNEAKAAVGKPPRKGTRDSVPASPLTSKSSMETTVSWMRGKRRTTPFPWPYIDTPYMQIAQRLKMLEWQKTAFPPPLIWGRLARSWRPVNDLTVGNPMATECHPDPVCGERNLTCLDCLAQTPDLQTAVRRSFLSPGRSRLYDEVASQYFSYLPGTGSLQFSRTRNSLIPRSTGTGTDSCGCVIVIDRLWARIGYPTYRPEEESGYCLPNPPQLSLPIELQTLEVERRRSLYEVYSTPRSLVDAIGGGRWRLSFANDDCNPIRRETLTERKESKEEGERGDWYELTESSLPESFPCFLLFRSSPRIRLGRPCQTAAVVSALAHARTSRWKKSGKISMLKRREKQLAARPTRIDMKQGFLSQSQSQLADHPFSTTAAARDDGSARLTQERLTLEKSDVGTPDRRLNSQAKMVGAWNRGAGSRVLMKNSDNSVREAFLTLTLPPMLTNRIMLLRYHTEEKSAHGRQPRRLSREMPDRVKLASGLTIERRRPQHYLIASRYGDKPHVPRPNIGADDGSEAGLNRILLSTGYLWLAVFGRSSSRVAAHTWRRQTGHRANGWLEDFLHRSFSACFLGPSSAPNCILRARREGWCYPYLRLLEAASLTGELLLTTSQTMCDGSLLSGYDIRDTEDEASSALLLHPMTYSWTRFSRHAVSRSPKRQCKTMGVDLLIVLSEKETLCQPAVLGTCFAQYQYPQTAAGIGREYAFLGCNDLLLCKRFSRPSLSVAEAVFCQFSGTCKPLWLMAFKAHRVAGTQEDNLGARIGYYQNSRDGEGNGRDSQIGESIKELGRPPASPTMAIPILLLVSQSLRAALILILQGLFLTRLDSEKSASRADVFVSGRTSLGPHEEPARRYLYLDNWILGAFGMLQGQIDTSASAIILGRTIAADFSHTTANAVRIAKRRKRVEAKAARWAFCVATVSTTSLGSRDGGSETMYRLTKSAKRRGSDPGDEMFFAKLPERSTPAAPLPSFSLLILSFPSSSFPLPRVTEGSRRPPMDKKGRRQVLTITMESESVWNAILSYACFIPPPSSFSYFPPLGLPPSHKHLLAPDLQQTGRMAEGASKGCDALQPILQWHTLLLLGRGATAQLAKASMNPYILEERALAGMTGDGNASSKLRREKGKGSSERWTFDATRYQNKRKYLCSAVVPSSTGLLHPALPLPPPPSPFPLSTSRRPRSNPTQLTQLTSLTLPCV